MIQPTEINVPNLSRVSKATLLTAINAAAEGLAEVTVSLTYDKQTESKPRIAGEDYIAMPGVANEALIGTLLVQRRADNAANRRKGVVGQVYLKIKSVTRSDGVEAFGYANIRPEGITAFVILGVKAITREPEAAEQPVAAEA